MRYFALLDFQHWVAAIAIGLILMIAVYITWRGYPEDREEQYDPFKEAGEDFIPQSEHYPLPPLLVFIYAGTIMWIFGYLLAIAMSGGALV